MKAKILSMMLVVILVVTVLCPAAYAADLSADEDYVAYGVRGTNAIGFDSLEAAIERLKNYSDVSVYLVANDKLTAEEVIIPAGMTVFIATSAEYEKDTITGTNISGAGTPGTAHATLTIPSGIQLTVNGTLVVAGNQQSTTGRSGFLTGDYGAIDLEGELIVNGRLYARGKIEGTGTVTANKGSAVYERFEISDWRGGNASEDAFNKDVFPFNLYELGGIDSKLVLNAGTTLFGQSFIYSSTFRLGASLNVPYISSTGSESSEYNVDGAIISFNESDDNGTVTFTRSEGVSTITIENAEIETGNITYVVRFFGIPVYNFSSKNTDCPFGYKTNVVLKNTAVDVNTKVKFLPGSSFTVGAGSALNITANGAMYFYAADTYKATYCQSIPTGWDVNLPAVLQVDGGTVTNNGTLASSSDTLDNIKGLDNKTLGTETSINEALQGDRSVTLVPVTFYKVDLPTTAE